MLYEDKINKISVVVSNKQISIYSLIIPDILQKDISISKEIILKNHTEPDKTINIRKQPDAKRIKKEIKNFIKERDEINRKK